MDVKLTVSVMFNFIDKLCQMLQIEYKGFLFNKRIYQP